jgi:hypothetical protein
LSQLPDILRDDKTYKVARHGGAIVIKDFQSITDLEIEESTLLDDTQIPVTRVDVGLADRHIATGKRGPDTAISVPILYISDNRHAVVEDQLSESLAARSAAAFCGF